ncbi:hypothetical protein [Megamonas funiformis]|jgi:hypothetical protein|uniref:hypothetical protein n=1 Tax=Megamonas funiformis TaxID=437897 RepID=UPI002251B976|nr:hypothetical protein [Megamonas funiformis]MCX4131418.1 hypothetical protein [Megamonas funiformis]
MGLFMDALNAMQNKTQEMREIYEEALYLDEKSLFSRYRYSHGTRKVAYMKAMTERFSKEELNEFHRQGLI